MHDAPLLLIKYAHDMSFGFDSAHLLALDPSRHRFVSVSSGAETLYSADLSALHASLHSKSNSLFGFHQLFRSSVELNEIYRREGRVPQNDSPLKFAVAVSLVAGPLSESGSLATDRLYACHDIVVTLDADALPSIITDLTSNKMLQITSL